MSLLCGRTAILAPDLSKDNIEYFMKKNPNIIFGSPALLELIKRNVSDGVDLSSCKDFITGGDFLFPKNRKEGIEFFKNIIQTLEFMKVVVMLRDLELLRVHM